MENSARGLTLLDPDHKVVVTGEEHHQPALAGYAPRADGRSRRVAVELGFVTARGGGRVIEIRLDGRRVGQLTPLMSQRYGPIVDDVLRRGDRPGAVALVIDGRRGVEVELRLPDAPTGAPAPGPRPPGRPPNPGPDTGRPARRRRTPYLIGGGVLALLLGVGAAVGGGDDTATIAAPSTPTVTAIAPTTTPATTTPTSAPTTSTPTTSAAPDLDEADGPAQIPPARVTRTPTADPEPRRAPDPVEPDPEPQADPEPAEVYYENCTAVRNAGAAPIRRGDPGYRAALDSDGDGEGCAGD